MNHETLVTEKEIPTQIELLGNQVDLLGKEIESLLRAIAPATTSPSNGPEGAEPARDGFSAETLVGSSIADIRNKVANLIDTVRGVTPRIEL